MFFVQCLDFKVQKKISYAIDLCLILPMKVHYTIDLYYLQNGPEITSYCIFESLSLSLLFCVYGFLSFFLTTSGARNSLPEAFLIPYFLLFKSLHIFLSVTLSG